MREIGRPRQAVSSVVAALLLGSASAVSAQQSPNPPPPQPDTTTVVEPVPKPDVAPTHTPPKEEEVKHVPPDASGIDLTTLQTKDLDLLYFDPVQTYLTP